MPVLTLPDGSNKKVPAQINGQQALEQFVPHLQKKALVVAVNGVLTDLATPITEDATITFLTFDDEEGKKVFWHSTAHLLAQAVMRCYPEAKLAIGPTWEQGFFYDIDHVPFSEEQLKKIEHEMVRIRDENLAITREVTDVGKAKQQFADSPYKLEVLKP